MGPDDSALARAKAIFSTENQGRAGANAIRAWYDRPYVPRLNDGLGGRFSNENPTGPTIVRVGVGW